MSTDNTSFYDTGNEPAHEILALISNSSSDGSGEPVHFCKLSSEPLQHTQIKKKYLKTQVKN